MIIRRIIVLPMLVAIGLIIALSGHVLGAGNGVLSLNPSSGSRTVGTTFSVTVYEDSAAQAIAATAADVKYDPAKLSLVSATNGTAFNLCVTPTQSSGLVSFGCTMTGSNTLTGKQAVGTVSFKVLAGSGATTVTFGNGSAIIRDSDNQNIWNGAPAGGSYSLVTPAPTPQTPAPVTPTPSVPKPTTPAAAPKSQSQPKAKNKSSNTKAAPKATAVAIAGTAAKPDIATQQANPDQPVVTDTSASVEAPGERLVAIKVIDADKKPVKNARVTINGRTAVTDESGVASFTDIPVGSHQIKIVNGSQTVNRTVEISDTADNSAVKQFDVTLAANKQPAAPAVIGGGSLAAILLVLAFVFRRKLLPRHLSRQPFAHEMMPQAPHSSVVAPQTANAAGTGHTMETEAVQQQAVIAAKTALNDSQPVPERPQPAPPTAKQLHSPAEPGSIVRPDSVAAPSADQNERS